QSRDTTRKAEGRRTPVHRVLIIAGYASIARNVFAILPVGRHPRRKPAKLIATIKRPALVEAVRPVDAGVDTLHIRCIEKTEQVGSVCARALKSKITPHLVLAADCLIEARYHRVLMLVGENWNLIVVGRIPRKVREWVEVQQSLRLRADWNRVALERQPSGWIKDLQWLPHRIPSLGKISSAFRQIRHKTGED